jgi:lipopolysaccharide export system protein LptA
MNQSQRLFLPPCERRRPIRVIPILVLLAVFFPWASGGGAEKKSIFIEKAGKGPGLRSDQPLRITSQALEADNKNMVILFTGNVVAKQGDLTIHADKVQVYYEKQEGGNEIREIVALGNVKIYEGDRLATGNKAVLDNREQKIVLTEQPKVWQGKDMVSGEKITVFLNEDRSIVEGGPERKVEVTLYPKSESPAGEGKR